MVAACQAVFAENWLECVGDILAGDAWFPPVDRAGRVGIAVVRNSPSFAASPALVQALVECASHEIRIATRYFLPDPSLLEALVERARTGVAITMMVPGPRMDHPWVRLSSRRLFRPLLDAGVRTFEYQPAMLHQKLLIVDELWSVVGTTNLDMLSFGYLDEINLAVRDEPGRIRSGVAARGRPGAQRRAPALDVEANARRTCAGLGGVDGGGAAMGRAAARPPSAEDHPQHTGATSTGTGARRDGDDSVGGARGIVPRSDDPPSLRGTFRAAAA